MAKFKKGDYVSIFYAEGNGQFMGIGQVVAVDRKKYVDGKGYIVHFMDENMDYHVTTISESWLNKATKKQYDEYMRPCRFTTKSGHAEWDD